MKLHLQNLSPHPQRRLVHTMVPAQALPPDADRQAIGVAPDGSLWCIGDMMGDQTRVFILAQMAGNERRTIQVQQQTKPDPGTEASSRMAGEQTEKLATASLSGGNPVIQPHLVITDADKGAIAVPWEFRSVELQSPLATVWRLGAEGLGYRGELWAFISGHQPAIIDYQGYVVWSDRASSDWTRTTKIEIVHTLGEHHIEMAAAMGQSRDGKLDSSTMFDSRWHGHMPADMKVDFYGAILLAQQAESQQPPPRDPADPEAAVMLAQVEAAVTSAEAARGGPIVASVSMDDWQGRAGPHRAVLSAPEHLVATESGFNWGQWRNAFDRREWANAKATGTTGDQGCFGRIKAMSNFMDGDPEMNHVLRYMATDYSLRSFHLLGTDHKTIPVDYETDATTYGGVIHYRADQANRWGRGTSDPTWGWDHGQRGFLDPQHRGNLYAPAALVINGDFVHRANLDYLIACDSRDVRLRQNALDAPRAAGRMLQEWAWWWCAANDAQREHLQELATRVLTIVEGRPTMAQGRAVKVLETIPPENSKSPFRNSGHHYFAPWQESMACDGLIAWAAVMQRIGRADILVRFLTAAVDVANAVVNEGVIEQPDGSFRVITYCKANVDGSGNPESYRVIPRPGAQTDLEPRSNTDLIYGGISDTWYSGAAFVASDAGNAKGNRFLRSIIQGARNQRDWEWLIR